VNPPTVVAIPALNEAERIGACLTALARQRDTPLPEVVVLLNNCTDESEAVVRQFALTAPMRVHAVDRSLPAPRAFAATARRLVMAHAARLAGPDGVLLTTDADAVAPPDWLAANLRAIEGVDAVAGRAVIDPLEACAVPQELHEADARECAYAALLDQIAALLDPDLADPWPRHDEENGATLAVRVAAWQRAGGIPAVPLGEDRAFVAALRRVDARIRHAPEVWVTVSGRLEGRARGGMADTMRRRMQAADMMLDERLEGAREAVRRAALRRSARRVHAGSGNPAPAAAALCLPVEAVEQMLSGRFGIGWAAIEAAAPVLRRRRVPVIELARQTRLARRMRDALLSETREDPAGTVRALPA
jgi:GT2 family glycosyltransferase